MADVQHDRLRRVLLRTVVRKVQGEVLAAPGRPEDERMPHILHVQDPRGLQDITLERAA